MQGQTKLMKGSSLVELYRTASYTRQSYWLVARPNWYRSVFCRWLTVWAPVDYLLVTVDLLLPNLPTSYLQFWVPIGTTSTRMDLWIGNGSFTFWMHWKGPDKESNKSEYALGSQFPRIKFDLWENQTQIKLLTISVANKSDWKTTILGPWLTTLMFYPLQLVPLYLELHYTFLMWLC